MFAQIQYLFVCTVGGIKYPIALVQAYKVVHINARSRVDKDLGLLRIRKEQTSELIPVASITRGAVAIPVSDDPLELNEKLVWDALDSDMFLHMKRDFPGYTTGR